MACRIKHKESGLYYCQSRRVKIELSSGENDYVKSNLSSKGKIYHWATLKWLKDGYYSHLLGCHGKPYGKQKVIPFSPKEWEIEPI